MSWGYGFREYVPVGQRIAQARQFARKQAESQGREPRPVSIQGTKIAKTFWGKAWCDHLESYSDYANRLPRGRTYVRNGSVVDLQISTGRLEAIVGGSEVYEIDIQIDQLKPAAWKKIRHDCSESIDSLLDLLGGRFSDGVMQRLTRRPDGLFPSPREIRMNCSCPDWAGLCKHLAAVLYGAGAHLDQHPELLFLLRGVDHQELVSDAVSADNLSTAFGQASSNLSGEDLGAMFGIELDTAKDPAETKQSPQRTRSSAKKATSRKSKKKTAKKQAKKTAQAGTAEKPASKTNANRTKSKTRATTKAAAKKSIRKKVAKKTAVKFHAAATKQKKKASKKQTKRT